jgi:hypothetical protein
VFGFHKGHVSDGLMGAWGCFESDSCALPFSVKILELPDKPVCSPILVISLGLDRFSIVWPFRTDRNPHSGRGHGCAPDHLPQQGLEDGRLDSGRATFLCGIHDPGVSSLNHQTEAGNVDAKGVAVEFAQIR